MRVPLSSPVQRLAIPLVALLIAAVALLGGATAQPPAAAKAASAPALAGVPRLEPAATVKVVVAGVVVVTARTAGGGQAGTGVVITHTGLVITNAHVVAGSDRVTVRLPGTNRSYPAELVGADTARDIAVLRVAARLRPVPVGDSDSVSLGDTVTSVGNAYGRGWMASGSGGVLATGVSATLTDIATSGPAAAGGGAGEARAAGTRLTGLIAARTNIRPGESGGAMFNQDGEVIGINVAYALSQPGKAGRASRHVGYAIPMNVALTVAHRLVAGVAGR